MRSSPDNLDTRPAPLGKLGAVVLLLVVAYGVGLRAWGIGETPFWSDEGESCVNAMTILRDGVPVGHYQGLPIYENTLIRPWPGHPEYEFRDSSYADNGLAVYHGWLPLYAIAASFKAGGVSPDPEPGPAAAPAVRHSAGEMRHRTSLGRLPAVAFGGAFLLAAFFAGRALYGTDAGWAALAAAAVCTPAVEFGREARYYSATLALATCCCLAAWAIARRGLWRDFLAGALAFALLFHTHMLSFAVACAALALVAPPALRRPGGFYKLAAFGAVVSLAVVPWVLLTGFLRAASDLPAARSLFNFPGDLLVYPRKHWPVAVLAVAGLLWLAGAGWLLGRLPAGRAGGLGRALVLPFSRHRGAFLFLAAWVALGFVCFTLLMPAASYFTRRVTLAVLGPGILFAAMLCCAAGRALSGGMPSARSAAVGCLLVVGGLAGLSRATFHRSPPEAGARSVFDVVESMRGWSMRPGTRLYAMPNEHLVLGFYTGLPVQSVAPVRESFFDSYPGDVIVFEAGPRHELFEADEVRRLAGAAGKDLSHAEADNLRRELPYHAMRQDIGPHVARVVPEQVAPPAPWVEPLVDAQRRHTRETVARNLQRSGNPMFRGYELADNTYWWQVFFYRFVGPEARTGANLNYAARVRGAEARLLPAEWVAYACPPPTPPAGETAAAAGAGPAGEGRGQ